MDLGDVEGLIKGISEDGVLWHHMGCLPFLTCILNNRRVVIHLVCTEFNCANVLMGGLLGLIGGGLELCGDGVCWGGGGDWRG